VIDGSVLPNYNSQNILLDSHDANTFLLDQLGGRTMEVQKTSDGIDYSQKPPLGSTLK
jgi:hypothetical protein